MINEIYEAFERLVDHPMASKYELVIREQALIIADYLLANLTREDLAKGQRILNGLKQHLEGFEEVFLSLQNDT